MLALIGAGTKRAWRRERDVPAKEYGTETARIIIALNPDPGAGGRAARGAAARKDLDNDHMAAAARARRAMIGRGVWIGRVVRCQWLDGCHWVGHQLLGARNVGFAAGGGEQPVVADAMKPLWQNVEQEAPDELLGTERHCAIPRLPAAVVLVAEGHAALVESNARRLLEMAA